MVVVGGGITGLTTALLCKEAGFTVAVLEAARVGDGSTGSSTGKVTSQHDLFYARAIDTLGASATQRYADANQWAIGALEDLADRHDVDAYPQCTDWPGDGGLTGVMTARSGGLRGSGASSRPERGF